MNKSGEIQTTGVVYRRLAYPAIVHTPNTFGHDQAVFALEIDNVVLKAPARTICAGFQAQMVLGQKKNPSKLGRVDHV
jgi:hypothetical protein